MLDEVSNTGLQNEAKSSAIEFSDRSQITDEQLVRAVLDGDEQAFAEIFERYRRLVTGVVGRFFRAPSRRRRPRPGFRRLYPVQKSVQRIEGGDPFHLMRMVPQYREKRHIGRGDPERGRQLRHPRSERQRGAYLVLARDTPCGIQDGLE